MIGNEMGRADQQPWTVMTAAIKASTQQPESLHANRGKYSFSNMSSLEIMITC